MGRRRKVLKRRLYTYEQLDARMYKASKAGTPPGKVPLYGNVVLDYEAGQMKSGIRIVYAGKTTRFTLATVYRTNDGTLYEVHGIGAGRNKPSVRKAIDLWQRYAPAFTPYDTEVRLYGGDTARYVLLDGMTMPVDSHSVPGIWRTVPRAMVPASDKWAEGGSWNKFDTLPNFTRRCRMFATRLRKSLAEDNMGEVQLVNHTGWSYSIWVGRGNALHVCTPPQGTQNGRRLVVMIAMHDKESRHFHHVDGDYGMAHCQFIALEEGKPRSSLLRWKCSRDAINGIREWIFGDIYIPGPG